MSKVRWCQLWFGVLLLAGCGGDDEKSARDAEAPDASAAGGDSAADGGGGRALRCGGEACELPPRFMFEEPCCLDRFTGGCGVMLGGTCQRYSKRDGRCPAATPDGKMGAEAEETGIIPCCASNGECGLDVGSGLGCIATSQACSLYAREFIELLGSQTCDGERLELAENCGAGLP